MLNQFKIFLVFAIILLRQICVAQNAFLDKESLMMLENDTIKREIASFSIKGVSLIKSDNLYKPSLTEIPIRRCSDKHIHLTNRNFLNSFIEISIKAEEEVSGKKIKNIQFIHVKYILDLPDSAFADIHSPKFCDKFTKRGKPITSNCKAFTSKDTRRVYICMLNGEGTNRYEVIWII
jgi:hypothetical protein